MSPVSRTGGWRGRSPFAGPRRTHGKSAGGWRGCSPFAGPRRTHGKSAGGWRGRRVLITSGPTREYLDPVRYLSNSSSGRMGRALAEAARRRGARVTVVSGPADVPPPAGVRVVPVLSALEMRRQVLRLCRRADVVIGAAAVSDWRVAGRARHKLKRGTAALRLTLLPNPDIIKEVAAIHRARRRTPGAKRCVVAGFALETRRCVAAARAKLASKGLDLVVANGPASLGSGRTRVSIVTSRGVRTLGELSKVQAAGRIMDVIGRMLA